MKPRQPIWLDVLSLTLALLIVSTVAVLQHRKINAQQAFIDDLWKTSGDLFDNQKKQQSDNGLLVQDLEICTRELQKAKGVHIVH
jgi:hypothetical protein